MKSLVAEGSASGLFFATDDVRATYEELKSRGGVEFQQEPTEQPYGSTLGSATRRATRCAWRTRVAGGAKAHYLG